MCLPVTTNGSYHFPCVCRILGDCRRDLARLRWLDTRRKANRVGLPDCDSEICFSLDQFVSACPTVSASE